MKLRRLVPLSVIALALGIYATLSVSFALPRASAEEPSLLYAIAYTATTPTLVAANLEVGSVGVIGGIGFASSLALAFCPPEGVPYTITDTFSPTTAQLAKLDLSTGAATPVGSPLGQALEIMGMTCSPDGTLYAIGQDDSTNPDFNSLYTVDRETGLASRIGSTGVLDSSDPTGLSGFLMALAFAPDGKLYGANSTSTLFRVNRSTGEAKKVVDLVDSASAPLKKVMGLAIDEDGNFYVADRVLASKIYKVDLDTGLATPILDPGLPFIHNIAFRSP